jgi:hypothetical protein
MHRKTAHVLSSVGGDHHSLRESPLCATVALVIIFKHRSNDATRCLRRFTRTAPFTSLLCACCSFCNLLIVQFEADSHSSQGSISGSSIEQDHLLPASFSESEQRELWDSVSRALLKLGKTGVLESHAR